MIPYIFLGLGGLALIAFCIFRDKKGSILAICIKSLVSAMFIAVAVSALVANFQPIDSMARPSIFLILGLVFGFIGDIVLDLKIYLKGLSYQNAEKDADLATYFGMAVFALGHIFYILATLFRFPGHELNIVWSMLIGICVAALIFVIAIGLLKMKFGKFLIPSIFYAFLLCTFVVYSIWSCATLGATTANIMFLVGSILFLVSDLILSMTYFSKPEDYKKQGIMNPESKFLIIANHVTYYAAQFLIALAILFI